VRRRLAWNIDLVTSGATLPPVIDEIGRPKKMTPTASPVQASS
jgi:hypothetical protein